MYSTDAFDDMTSSPIDEDGVTDEPSHVPAAVPVRRRPPPSARVVLQPPPLRVVSAWEHWLTLLSGAVCGLCNHAVTSPTTPICDACEEQALERIRTLSFGQVYSAFAHEGFGRRAVTGLKYRQERWRGAQLAQHLALLWRAQARHDIDRRDLLVPIPIHPAKVQTRGYNQALVVAQGVRQRVPLALRATGLSRQDDAVTMDQKHLNRDQRLAITGRFRADPRLRGRRVWLIDDVVTTGATLEDAAQALHAIGATPVGAMTLTWRP